jgi:hypothetical protein
MRPPPTGEAPEQVGDFIHILRRTQVSAAFGQREIGGDDRAVAGLGVVFYPYTGNDPRTDTRFRTCMTTAVDALAAGSAFVNAVYPAENQNLSAQQINELLVQRDVIEPDFSAVNPGSNFGDELREHLRRSDQGQLVTDAVIDPIVNDFNNQIERRARSQSLTNAQINEVLEAAGLVETDFEQTSRLTLNPQSIEIIAGLIETYLKEAGLAGDAASAAIANGYRGRVRQILARPGEPSQGVLQATFINRFLEFQGVEDPKFEIDDVAPAAEEQMVAFMRARGASDSAIASAREGYYNRRIAVARAAIDEAWIQRFLASWGIPGASDFHFVRNSVETEVNQFLFAKHPDLRISTGPDASRPMTREDVVDITLSVGAANLEGFSDRLTDSSAFGQFNTAIGNCRSDAAKYYLQGSEFTVGIGSAWTSADDSYERLAPDGISAWLRYRYPLPVTREETLSNGDKIEVPVGYLNLFYRRIVDEEVELSQSSKDGGANLVRSMPSTAALYSSSVGVRPRMADSTTTGVEASSDSPFLSSESSTTRPWNRRVEVASTVSPLPAFSWLPMHRLQPGRSR